MKHTIRRLGKRKPSKTNKKIKSKKTNKTRRRYNYKKTRKIVGGMRFIITQMTDHDFDIEMSIHPENVGILETLINKQIDFEVTLSHFYDESPEENINKYVVFERSLQLGWIPRILVSSNFSVLSQKCAREIKLDLVVHQIIERGLSPGNRIYFKHVLLMLLYQYIMYLFVTTKITIVEFPLNGILNLFTGFCPRNTNVENFNITEEQIETFIELHRIYRDFFRIFLEENAIYFIPTLDKTKYKTLERQYQNVVDDMVYNLTTSRPLFYSSDCKEFLNDVSLRQIEELIPSFTYVYYYITSMNYKMVFIILYYGIYECQDIFVDHDKEIPSYIGTVDISRHGAVVRKKRIDEIIYILYLVYSIQLSFPEGRKEESEVLCEEHLVTLSLLLIAKQLRSGDPNFIKNLLGFTKGGRFTFLESFDMVDHEKQFYPIKKRFLYPFLVTVLEIVSVVIDNHTQEGGILSYIQEVIDRRDMLSEKRKKAIESELAKSAKPKGKKKKEKAAAVELTPEEKEAAEAAAAAAEADLLKSIEQDTKKETEKQKKESKAKSKASNAAAKAKSKASNAAAKAKLEEEKLAAAAAEAEKKRVAEEMEKQRIDAQEQARIEKEEKEFLQQQITIMEEIEKAKTGLTSASVKSSESASVKSSESASSGIITRVTDGETIKEYCQKCLTNARRVLQPHIEMIKSLVEYNYNVCTRSKSLSPEEKKTFLIPTKFLRFLQEGYSHAKYSAYKLNLLLLLGSDSIKSLFEEIYGCRIVLGGSLCLLFNDIDLPMFETKQGALVPGRFNDLDITILSKQNHDNIIPAAAFLTLVLENAFNEFYRQDRAHVLFTQDIIPYDKDKGSVCRVEEKSESYIYKLKIQERRERREGGRLIVENIELGIVDVSFKYFPFEKIDERAKLELPTCEIKHATIEINMDPKQIMSYSCQRLGSYIFERLYFLEKYKIPTVPPDSVREFYIQKSIKILDHIQRVGKMNEKAISKYTQIRGEILSLRGI
jgi:hypothetical protein